MAVQAVDLHSGEKTELPETTNGASTSSSVQQKAQAVTEKAIDIAEQYGSVAAHKSRSFLDSVFPPDERENITEKARAFISSRPQLSAFLAVNLLFTSIPLLLFLFFSISTFVVSLLVALTTALLVAGTFALFAVGAALLILLPTILFTTFAACSLFAWGRILFLIYNRARGNPSNQTLNTRTNGKGH